MIQGPGGELTEAGQLETDEKRSLDTYPIH